MQPQAHSPTPKASEPSDAELLDILYEILADETGEDHGVAVETIEAFLHEHARNPQKAGSLAAFFREHGLSSDPAAHGRDPALKAVPSGVHAGMLPITSAPNAAPASAPAVSAMPEELTPARPRVRVPGATSAIAVDARPRWLMPTIASLALMVGLVGAVSAFAALEERELERELSLSKLQLRATSEAVDALRIEARSLHEKLDVQRADEQKLREELGALQEAERLRSEQEEAERERKARRWRGPARRVAATPAATAQ